MLRINEEKPNYVSLCSRKFIQKYRSRVKLNGPFTVSKKKASFFAIISVFAHMGFLVALSGSQVNRSDLAHRPPKPLKVLEPIAASKERALHETLNRFFPYLMEGGKKGTGKSSDSEPSFLAVDRPEKRAKTQGEDSLHLINAEDDGPEIFAVDSSSSDEGLEMRADPALFAFEGALTLEPADITKKLVASVERSIGDDALRDSSSGIDVTSSTVLLSKEAPVTQAFELESKLFDNPEPSVTFAPDDTQALFAKETGSKDKEPLHAAPALEIPDLKLELDSPHLTLTKALPKSAEVHSSDEGIILTDSFSIEAVMAKIPGSKEFAFEILLKPLPTAKFDSLEQTLFFLVDRSHSIDKRQFDNFKRCISHALSLLPKSSKFNISVFDHRIYSLDETPISVNRRHIIRGKTFLIGEDHGGLFASTDMFKALGWAMGLAPKNLPSTAILLTDGDTFLSPHEQMHRLSEFVNRRPHNFALFTAAAGSKNNLGLMRALAQLSLGELVFEPDLRYFEKTFTTFIKSIARPIAQDVTLEIISGLKDQKITWMHNGSALPLLYARRPYILRGTTNAPSDFTLFIQGKGAKGPITIKKTVTFKKVDSMTPDMTEALELKEALGKLSRSFGKMSAPLYEIKLPVPRQKP